MDQIELQKLFFNHVKAKIPAHFSLADEIAEYQQRQCLQAHKRRKATEHARAAAALHSL